MRLAPALIEAACATFRRVKFARAWLLTLLALLLPFQGAVWAAAACPCDPTSPATAAQSEPPDDMSMDHDAMGDVMSDAMPDHMPHHVHAVSSTQKCGLCAACCSGFALAAVAPATRTVVTMARAAFGLAPLPAASFIADGEGRPPRSS